MDPVRPNSVGAEATCVPPDITQAGTLASMDASNHHDNGEAIQSWAHGLEDWATNAKIDKDLGKPLQPRPKKPDVYRTKVTYADINGTVQTGRQKDDGDYYAWVETVVS